MTQEIQAMTEHPEICELCGTGAHEGVALYRKNAKGQPGVFRCNPCYDIKPAKQVVTHD